MSEPKRTKTDDAFVERINGVKIAENNRAGRSNNRALKPRSKFGYSGVFKTSSKKQKGVIQNRDLMRNVGQVAKMAANVSQRLQMNVLLPVEDMK